MTTNDILFAIHKSIKIAYSIDLLSDNDTLIFRYKIGAKRYTMQFNSVSDIKTKMQLQVLIAVIQSNISYHEQEQEQEKK